MPKDYVNLNEEQRQLLISYWRFYRALEGGDRRPTTPAQRRFVSVCRGECEPQTKHELAYLLGRRLVENSTLTWPEVARRGFRVPPREVKDSGFVRPESVKTRVEYHAVDVGRFSSKRRWVPRHNW